MSASIPTSSLADVVWPAVPRPAEARLLALVQQLGDTQWWSADDILEHQLKQLELLFRHAAKTVPAYRDRLGRVFGLPPGALSLDHVRALPVLKRGDLQGSGDSFASREAPSGHGRSHTFRTSGSTGTPVEVRRSDLDLLINAALGLRYHHWHKRDFAGSNVTIKTVDGRAAPGAGSWAPCYATGPSLVYDIQTPTPRLFERFIGDDPDYLQTHPSLLEALVKLSQETGRNPQRLREVRTFGETVSDDLRELVASVWRVSLSDNYSSEEFGIIALQCPTSRHLHVQAEHVFLEVLDEGGAPCAPGAMGRVVVTALQNFVEPLIRYDIGDYAIAGGTCSCGRGLPVLERVVGRERNLVRLPGGDKIHPVFREEALLAIAPLRQYQLVQKSLDLIEVHAIVDGGLSPVQETALETHFNQSFGHRFTYRFVVADALPRAPNGKFEIFRSEL